MKTIFDLEKEIQDISDAHVIFRMTRIKQPRKRS